MCLRMYVSVVSVFVRLCVCVCVRLCACVCVLEFMPLCGDVRVCGGACVFVRAFVYSCERVCVCVLVCVSVCVLVRESMCG